jgi:hypothetical protein
MNKYYRKVHAKIVLALILLSSVLSLQAQSPNKINLEKYWRYRERLVKDFVVVTPSNGAGTNIPAVGLFLDDNGNKQLLHWDDANSNISHYLSMLATEYKLLKEQGHNYQKTVNELYMALVAIDRLDRTSESYFRSDGSVSEEDLNGWMIRDDVNQDFWNQYYERLGFSDASDGYYHSVFKDGAGKGYQKQSLSQDNVYHLLEGLALVNALVESEYIEEPTPALIDFPQFAKTLTFRVIKMMQHTVPIYRINTGDNFTCLLSKPSKWDWVLSPAWALMQQTNYEALCSIKSRWYIQNPVTGNLAEEGSGDEFDTWLYFCYGVEQAGNKILGAGYDVGLAPSSGWLQREVFFSILDGSYKDDAGDVAVVFKALVGNGILDFIGSAAGIPPGVIPLAVNDDIVHSLIGRVEIDPYKVKTLAAIGNIGGEETFWKLRGELTRYSHFMLMYIALHGAPTNYAPGNTEYEADKQYFESLLSLAPCRGPRSYSINPHDDYSFEWSAESRLVWPEYKGRHSGLRVEINGLDYMMLYNLYSLVYGADYRKLTVEVNTGISNSTYTETAVDIIAQNEISGTSNVDFSANHSVKFMPGFAAKAGATVIAKIVPSAVDYSGYSQRNICTNLPLNARIASHSGSGLSNDRTDDKNAEIPLLSKETHPANIVVYPNPSEGVFVIEIKSKEKTKMANSYSIKTISGTQVQEGNFDENGIAAYTAGLQRGIYIVTVNAGTRRYIQKLVVK